MLIGILEVAAAIKRQLGKNTVVITGNWAVVDGLTRAALWAFALDFADNALPESAREPFLNACGIMGGNEQ